MMETLLAPSRAMAGIIKHPLEEHADNMQKFPSSPLKNTMARRDDAPLYFLMG